MTNFSNINIVHVCSNFEVYFHQSELGPETDSYALISEQAVSEVSDDENEVDIQADHEGDFNKYGSPTQLRINSVR